MHAAQFDWLKEFCQTNLLAEKWLLAPNQRIGLQWKDRINLAGVRTVNLHVKTLPALVIELVDERLISENREYASALIVRLLVHQALDRLSNAGKLNYFPESRSKDQLAEIITKSISDYRLAGLTVRDFNPAAIEEATKAKDLTSLLSDYEAELQNLNLVDYADCLRLAAEDAQLERLRTRNISILLPFDLDLSPLETQFIRSLDDHGLMVKADRSKDACDYSSLKLDVFRAAGEVNEVRTMLQDIAGNEALRFDQVEVLHTDYQTYVPLFHELLAYVSKDGEGRIDGLPVTFAEGVACIYSRPGRALRSWLRWLASDCLQSQLVHAVREGLIRFEDQSLSFSRLAHVLRKIPIGLGRKRYVVKLQEAFVMAEKKVAAAKAQREDADGQAPDKPYDYGSAVINELLGQIGAIIESSPARHDNAETILQAARHFLAQFARSANQLDEFAKQKLIEDIDGLLEAIRLSPGLDPDVWTWLENLPIESRVLASGPRPGRLHVDHIARGGHSGRPRVFLLGLDDTRFPQRGGQDPLLLDFERRQLSDRLITSGDANTKSVSEFFGLVERLAGSDLSCSYSTVSLRDDRDLYPSSVLLELFRRVRGDTSASLADFEDAAGPPRSFLSDKADSLLATDDWWCAGLLTTRELGERTNELHMGFPHFASGTEAQRRREDDEFGEFDGFVPAAGRDLDPTCSESRRMSSSRLESCGTCPRRYFFKHGLRIAPPDEYEVDPERWLDHLAYGNLLHGLFEEFLTEVTSEDRMVSHATDLPRLLELLQQKIDEAADDYPIPNRDAYERQVKQLEKTCEIFLREEERFCQKTDSIPWVLEASIGLGEEPRSPVDCRDPVELTLSDGRVLQVGGRIDRIDRVGSGTASFGIWDYKSGSSYGFDPASPFQHGRKLQPFLYVGMLRHRLKDAIGQDAKVSCFGYFFPSPKTNGARIWWTELQLADGDQVLRNICDLIASGSFVATDDKKDCKFCDFVSICGDPEQTAENTLMKLHHPANVSLEPFRQLREIDIENGGCRDD